MITLRIACSLLCLILSFQTSGFAQTGIKTGMQVLPGKIPKIAGKYSGLMYDFDLAQEHFYVSVPQNYDGAQPFGLLVFMSAADDVPDLPPGWSTILEDRKLIFIAPQRVGNNQPNARRVGMAVVSACKVCEMANIDTNRIYVAGLSGGARIATYAAFVHPDLFSGVFAICGSGFCRKVDRVKSTQTDDYGCFSIDDKHAQDTKQKVRFVMVTGAKDFRYGNILDIYNGGFLKDGYQVKLLDIPGMGHEMCSPQALSDGLRFLDRRWKK